jgi:hypothetical protein
MASLMNRSAPFTIGTNPQCPSIAALTLPTGGSVFNSTAAKFEPQPVRRIATKLRSSSGTHGIAFGAQVYLVVREGLEPSTSAF